MNTNYALQYSLDLETWYDGDSYDMTENGYIYFRLTDGDNVSNFYATGYVGNIDKLAPTIDSVESLTNNITFTASDSSSSLYGVSGIVGYYISISSDIPDEDDFIDCRDESGNGISKFEITINELEQEIIYYIWVIDGAGNISDTIETTIENVNVSSLVAADVASIMGDYVDYPIDVNNDGDTTNDWRLFYVADDAINDDLTISGQVFLITADYVEGSSEYLDLDATGLSVSSSRPYALYWSYSSVPEKQWTDLMSDTTNSIFMFKYTYGSSSTKNNMNTISTLLNTENWTKFVDSSYANYAIGSPTLRECGLHLGMLNMEMN